MTVSTTIAKSGPYAGAGTTGPFTVGFRFLQNDHLRVVRTNLSGIDQVLNLTTEYTVSGAGNQTGSVTLVLPLPVGWKLTILRAVPAIQETDYVQNDAFPAESHERALDKLTMIVQQQQETLGRTLRAPESDTAPSLFIPSVAERAGRYLSFTDLGVPIATTFDVGAVEEASQAAIAAAAAAAVSEINASNSASSAAASAAQAAEEASFVSQQVSGATPSVVRFSGDGSTTDFVLPSVPGSENNTQVYIDGVYQQKDTYSVSGNTILFSTAPPTGSDNIEIVISPSVSISIGASDNISFQQAGAGAIVRSVTSKLRDIVSLSDFGVICAGGNDSIVMQIALDALSALGGGTLHVKNTVTGILRIMTPVILRENVSIVYDDNITIDITGIPNSGFAFSAQGSMGPEINTSANMTTGDYIFNTTTPHGFSPGDWVFVKGQRASCHADAGPTWLLGSATTAGTSPFFAEPVQVRAVNSPTQFTTTVGLIFPNYRTDDTQETYATPRPRTTLQKINFVKGINVRGGKYVKGATSSNFYRLELCERPTVEVLDCQLGHSGGSVLYEYSCIMSDHKLRARRPADFVIIGDHSQYNSFRPIGTWYSRWDIQDENGSQGLDESYTAGGHGCIGTYVKCTGLNQREEVMTSHGASYGLVVDCISYGSIIGAVFSRARYAKITAVVRGSHGAQRTLRGVMLSHVGMADTDVKVQADGVEWALELQPIGSGSENYPYFKLNTTIDVMATNVKRAIQFVDREVLPASSSDVSGVVVKNLTVKNAEEGAYIGHGWERVNFPYVRAENVTGISSTSAVLTFSGIAGEAVIGTISHSNVTRVIYKGASASPFFPRGFRIDLNNINMDSATIEAIPGTAIYTAMTGNYLLDKQDVGIPLFNTFNGTRTVTITSAANTGMPIGAQFSIINWHSSGTITAVGSGVTITARGGTASLTGPGKMTLTKVSNAVWTVGGDHNS